MRRDELATLLQEGGIEVDTPEGEDFLGITLPGEKRLKTQVLIFPGQESVRFEAFVCRAVEENYADVYKFLLQHNRRSFGVAYTLDSMGDIYLSGNVSANSTVADYDRVLGQILSLADGDFNRILELGFATSIRHEWAWRLDRGESIRNLAAFESLRPSEEEIPRLLQKSSKPSGTIASRIEPPVSEGSEDPAGESIEE